MEQTCPITHSLWYNPNRGVDVTDKEMLISLIKARGNCDLPLEATAFIVCQKCPLRVNVSETEQRCAILQEEDKVVIPSQPIWKNRIYDKALELYVQSYPIEDIIEVLM